MGSIISNIEYYLPEKIVTNELLEKQFSDWNAAKIQEKTGIAERHVVGENETALDLAYQACLKVLNKYDKNKIDFLLLCTQSPDYYLPTSACVLQEKLGLKKSIGAFDFNLGCSGFVYGLAIAKGLIQASLAKNVLLVTSETYTKLIHPKDKGNRTIFGDGAAATIIEECDEEHLLNFILGTDGSGCNNLIVPNGGLRRRFDPEAGEITDENGSIRTDNNLFMNGPEIFNFTIGAIPNVFQEVLEKNSVKLEDIQYVIFHQANKYMIDYLRKKIKIPQEKFYMDMLTTGNTVSATIPIALKNCIDKSIIKKADYVLLLGFGVGYSWGGTIVKI
jgi:3-oxoacyl-[acyl-carrier-protein] synthase III